MIILEPFFDIWRCNPMSEILLRFVKRIYVAEFTHVQASSIMYVYLMAHLTYFIVDMF